MSRTFYCIEKSFWIVCAVITVVSAFGMLFKGAWSIVTDFAHIKQVLSKEIFYAIICFELFQMAKIRIEGRSHKMVLYHFIFMATLTLGREIFLIHNLDIWVIFGFSLMVLTYVLFYRWRDHFPDEVKAERGQQGSAQLKSD